MKKLITVVLLLAMLIGGGYLAFNHGLLNKVIVSSSIEVLRSSDVMQLTTRKVVTQVVVNYKESDFWWGSSQVVLVAPVTMHYGIDLTKISDSDITVENGQGRSTLRIHLPEVELLAFEVDEDNIQNAITKENISKVLHDKYIGHDPQSAARKVIKKTALAFADKYQAYPSKEDLTRQIRFFLYRFPALKYLEDLGLLKIVLD